MRSGEVPSASPPNFSFAATASPTRLRPRRQPPAPPRGHVGALDECGRFLTGREIDGGEWLHQRRQRFKRRGRRSPAVRDARLDAARAIRRASVRRADLVVCLGAAQLRARPSPISTPLTAWIPSRRPRAAHRAVLLRRVRAEPGRNAVCPHSIPLRRCRAPSAPRRRVRAASSSTTPRTEIPIAARSAFATEPAAT